MWDDVTKRSAVIHAKERWPKESVGAIVAGTYIRLDNVHPEPETSFRVGDEQMLELLQHPGYQGLVHNHPQGQRCPSKEDMIGQQSGSVPWYIVVLNSAGSFLETFGFGDQLPMEKLEGRRFRFGVHDCWSIVRDWRRFHELPEVPDVPRANDFWSLPGNNDLVDSVEKYISYTPVKLEEVVRGDVVIMKILSAVPNHFGVYLGNGLMLHHLTNRLSREEPVNRWAGQVVRVIRIEGAK